MKVFLKSNPLIVFLLLFPIVCSTIQKVKDTQNAEFINHSKHSSKKLARHLVVGGSDEIEQPLDNGSGKIKQSLGDIGDEPQPEDEDEDEDDQKKDNQDEVQKESKVEGNETPLAQGPSKVASLMAQCNCPKPDASGDYAETDCPTDKFADATEKYIKSFLTILKGSPTDKKDNDPFKPLKIEHEHGNFKLILIEESNVSEGGQQEKPEKQCGYEVRAYQEEFGSFNVVFVFVYQSHSSVVEVKTAVLFVPKETKSYAFNERELKSTKDIENIMLGDRSDDLMAATLMNMDFLDRIVGVEISTRVYFDGKQAHEKNLACQHTTGVFGRFFELLTHIVVTTFDLEIPTSFESELGYVSKEDNDKQIEDSKNELFNKFIKSAGLRKNRELLSDRSLAQELSILLTEVSKELSNSKERRLETVEDAKQLFVAENFKELFSDVVNPFQWKNLRKLLFYLNALYSDHAFTFIIKEHICENDNDFRLKNVLILKSGEKELVSFSFIITAADDQDPNIHICLDALGEMGSSVFLSSLNCYDLDPNAYNDPEEKEEAMKKQKTDFWKILEMMVGNFADTIEEVCMLSRTRLSPSKFRKLFYLLEVEKPKQGESVEKVNRIKLTPEEHEIISLLELNNPSNEHKLQSIKLKKEKKPKSLIIESDPSGFHDKLKLIVSLPIEQLGLHKKLKFLKINVELIEEKYDLFVLKLNAFDRNLEILVSTYWFEDVSIRIEGDHVTALSKYAGRSFISEEEITVMNEMLFAFLRNKIEVIINDWIYEIIDKKPDFDNDFDKPLFSLVPSSFWKPLEEYDISSFSEVGTLFYSLMAVCDFYDKNTNQFLIKDEAKLPSEEDDFNPEALKNYKVNWEKISRSVQAGLNDDESSQESAFLTDEEIQLFPQKQDEILSGLMDALTYLDSKQELGGVDFKFKSSTSEMGHFNEKNLSNEITVKIAFLREDFWNSVYFLVHSAFFTGEYYFAANSYSTNLYNLAKIVSEIMEQQKVRIEKALNPTQVVVLTKQGLETSIEKFLTDNKVKNCKIEVESEKKSIYVVNIDSDQKECEKDPKKIFDHSHSYFELSEIEKSTKNCPQKPCDSDKKKQGFKLNFVFNPKLKKIDDKKKHLNGLYSSSYEFFARYNYQYNDVVSMYLKRGLYHLGVLDIEVGEGVEHNFVEEKVKGKPQARSIRELMSQVIPVKGLLKSLGQSNFDQVRTDNSNLSNRSNLISKMTDVHA